MTWLTYFTTTPAGLQTIPCGYVTGATANGSPNNLPYAITIELEAEPGAMFPDFDIIWVEP